MYNYYIRNASTRNTTKLRILKYGSREGFSKNNYLRQWASALLTKITKDIKKISEGIFAAVELFKIDNRPV